MKKEKEKNINLHTICAAAGFSESDERRLAAAPLSAAAFSTEIPDFLHSEFIIRYFSLASNNTAVLPELLETAKLAAASPAATACANLMHTALYGGTTPVNIAFLPEPKKLFGERAGLFQLLVALSALPLIEESYRALGLPEHYAHDAFQWLGGTIPIYAAAHNGVPGHTLRQSSWLRHHIEKRLFRIGRLEYLRGFWSPELPALYRSRKTGALQALCRAEWCFDADGFRTAPGTPGSVTTRLRDDGKKITGTAVTPFGMPELTREIELDAEEYIPEIAPWDETPGIHIPGGSAMTREAVRASLLEAANFFEQYLSVRVKAFHCFSWILNPAWEEELPGSNLADFQKQVFLTPAIPANFTDKPGMFFVFGRDDGDIRDYPDENRMHRAFHHQAELGRPLRAGGMFVLTRDLKNYGTEFYRIGASRSGR